MMMSSGMRCNFSVRILIIFCLWFRIRCMDCIDVDKSKHSNNIQSKSRSILNNDEINEKSLFKSPFFLGSKRIYLLLLIPKGLVLKIQNETKSATTEKSTTTSTTQRTTTIDRYPYYYYYDYDDPFYAIGFNRPVRKPTRINGDVNRKQQSDRNRGQQNQKRRRRRRRRRRKRRRRRRRRRRRKPLNGNRHQNHHHHHHHHHRQRRHRYCPENQSIASSYQNNCIDDFDRWRNRRKPISSDYNMKSKQNNLFGFVFEILKCFFDKSWHWFAKIFDDNYEAKLQQTSKSNQTKVILNDRKQSL
ncbi:hypothetical protein SSS_08716 [Sarcoptes scabiei]|uniref:Uncharacterized protein n=1 Tax=Sarcoptes scabiei TaxID=52283 RepID=A0A834R7E8_SARSC|nr:hypothetical protein SSS_08716 [Sarcoptes scabiei]